MLSLSRVNISYMCLNTSPPHWNPAFKCAWGIGMRTVGELSEGFLAHLSRRLTGELIGYPWIRRPSVRRPSASVGVRRPHFQTSSPLKPLGQSKPNFMWSLLGKGERKFI